MLAHLPQILTLLLTALALWLGWRAFRLSPAGLQQIAPYRQPRRALIVLSAREGHLPQQAARVVEHIEAAMALGMPVLTVQQTESLMVSVVASIFRRGGHMPGPAEDAQLAPELLMFSVSSDDAFDNADFEKLLIQLQVSELYLISGNPAFPVGPTACSAQGRAYQIRSLGTSAAGSGTPAGTPLPA